MFCISTVIKAYNTETNFQFPFIFLGVLAQTYNPFIATVQKPLSDINFFLYNNTIIRFCQIANKESEITSFIDFFLDGKFE